MGAFVTTIVQRELMKVPNMMPKVIRFCVESRRVTAKHTRVQARVHTNDPTVSEHRPDIVAAAAPRQAADPSPRE